MVSASLAHYLGQGQTALFPRLELRRDLGLEPLHLVLFLLALEESDQFVFPFEELQYVSTVDELVQLVSAWLDDCDRSEQVAAEEESYETRRTPLESGTWLTARASRRPASGER